MRFRALPSKAVGGFADAVKKEASGIFSASIALMSKAEISILLNDEVRARTSDATVRVLEERANLPPRAERYLSDDLFQMLLQLVDAILPQGHVGTSVPIAETIDRRLQSGSNDGWRYAELPPDGEAYVRGLTAFHTVLQQTPMKTFEAMPASAREGYLSCIANGDVDGPARFPLSTWLKVVRGDVVKAWVSHPEGMQAIQYYGFADGATGNEGWVSIGPNSAAPFEYGALQQTAAPTEGDKQ